MAEIVKGLFGIDPQAYQQNQLENQQASAMQFARLTPAQQAQYGGFRGGQQVANVGANLMGVQDPELQAQQVASQLASQFDLSTADGMTSYAQALGQKSQETGLPALNGFANMAGQKALSMKGTQLGNTQTQLNIEKTQQAVTREEKLREALSALPETATEEDYLKIYRQFGSPDQQARIMEMASTAKAKVSAKQEAQDTLNQTVKDDLLGSALEGKAYIERLLPRVGTSTVGLIGGALSHVPQTEAASFASDLKTLQSQLTMAVMAAAKAQSKTGATGFGALNMKELEVIKQNIADLDQMKLSPEDFKIKLNTVYKYFDKLEKKATGTYNPREQSNATANEAQTPAAKPGSSRDNPIKLD